MSLYRKLQGEITRLEELINSGDFIRLVANESNVKDEILVEGLIEKYRLLLVNLKAASETLNSEIEKIKAESKHRIQAGITQGLDAKSIAEDIGKEYQCGVYPSVRVEYQKGDALIALKGSDLYDEAVKCGAVKSEEKIVSKLLTKEMKEELKPFERKKVYRLYIQ